MIITSGYDDTGPLNEALRRGGVVELPPGVHRTTDTLRMYHHTRLVGNGVATIMLDTHSNVDVLLARQVTNVRVEGVIFDGRKDLKVDGVNTGRGIHFDQVERGRIDDVFVRNTWEHGARIGGTFWTDSGDTDDIIITRSTFKDCGNALNDRGTGIWCFWRVRDTILSKNIIVGCQAGGIMVDDSSSDATPNKEGFRFIIDENIIRDGNPLSAFGRAICVEGSRYFTLTSNIIATHNRGIVVTDGQAASLTGYGIIDGNQVSTRHMGVQITDASDLVVSDNDIECTNWSSVAHAAVKLEQGTAGRPLERIRLVDNRIRSNGLGVSTRMQGGYVGSGAGMIDIKVIDNDLFYTGPAPNVQHAGIQLGGITRPHVRRNDVQGFYDGIFVDADCTDGLIRTNLAEMNTRYGIRLGGPGHVLRSNQCRGNGTASFHFDLAARVPSTFVQGNIPQDSDTGMVDGPTYA